MLKLSHLCYRCHKLCKKFKKCFIPFSKMLVQQHFKNIFKRISYGIFHGGLVYKLWRLVSLIVFLQVWKYKNAFNLDNMTHQEDDMSCVFGRSRALCFPWSVPLLQGDGTIRRALPQPPQRQQKRNKQNKNRKVTKKIEIGSDYLQMTLYFTWLLKTQIWRLTW